MSWLSTFVHNNRALINTIPLPGVGSIANIFDPAASLQPAFTPPVYSLPYPQAFQSAGINPRRPQVTSRVDSGGSQIRLPGGISAGVSHKTSTSYASAAQQVQGRVTGSAALCGITGYHLAKTPALRAQGICVKNRHMNFGNGRAVKRAVRRLRGFHKLAVRVERSLHLGRSTHRRAR